MGDFLQNLKDARHKPVAIRQRFRIEYVDGSPDVYAFFESTDDVTFYRSQISSLTRSSGRLRVYLCGNKKSVWFHYEYAEQEGKLHNTLFFVDKDLDDLTGHALPLRPRIFVTDLYSVENYFCTEEAVTAALEQLIFLPNEQNDYPDILEKFRTGLDDLAVQLRPLFAEIILHRRQNAIVLFSDFGDSLSPCFALDAIQTKSLPNWEATFRLRCKYEAEILRPEDIQEVEKLLSTKRHHEWLRGKFALWFFIHFIENVWGGVAGKYLNDQKKIKKALHLHPDNVFFVMQGKHPQPIGLSDFLTANLS